MNNKGEGITDGIIALFLLGIMAFVVLSAIMFVAKVLGWIWS